jgi:hypothetical protein
MPWKFPKLRAVDQANYCRFVTDMTEFCGDVVEKRAMTELRNFGKCTVAINLDEL